MANNFEGKDIYEIYQSNGIKMIKVFGDLEFGDEWMHVERCGMDFELNELLNKDSIKEYINNYESWCKTLVGEFSEMFDANCDADAMAYQIFCSYNNGKEPKPLSYNEITIDTPCGVYYDK